MNNIITGIGSGLNINALVEAQVNAANAPRQNQINRQKIRLETNISTLGMFKGALHQFQAKLTKLTNEGFKPYVSTSSEPKIAQIKTTDDAQNGSFKLEVSQLASGAKIGSKLLDGNYQTQADGNLKINLGENNYTVSISAGSDLAQIAEQLNKELGQHGITATVANTEQGSRLLLSSDKTGTNMPLSVNADKNLAELEITGTKQQQGDEAGVLNFASDAKFKLDGLELTSHSNNLENIITGVNLELQETGTTNLTIRTNKTGVKESAQEFINNYNELVQLSSHLSMDDISLRNLMMSMARGLSSSLAQLGVSTHKDGTLHISKETELSASQMSAIFTSKNGVLAQMEEIYHDFSGDKDLLSTKQDRLNQQLQKLGLEQQDLNKKSEALSAMLYRKFNAMDETVSKLNAIRQSISATFDAINNKNKV